MGPGSPNWVSELVESKNWKTQEDLGNNYIRYSAHAYGKGSYGRQKPAWATTTSDIVLTHTAREVTAGRSRPRSATFFPAWM